MKIIIHTLNIFWAKARKSRLDFSIGCPQNKNETTRNPMLAVSITNEQKVKVSLKPTTATGKPAAVDGKPTWTVQSGDSTVQVADDGLSATLVSSDTPGTTSILVEADADIGEGTENIQSLIELQVVGAKASNFGFQVSDPEAK